MAIAALGMPDIGGVALMVWALDRADRLMDAFAAGGPGEAADERAALRGGLQLAAALFALFLFRRWYLFAAAGIVLSLGLELARLALARGSSWRWRSALASGALGGLALLALAAPVILDWLPQWRAHDYSSIYAGYDYGWAELLRRLGDWYGWAVIALSALAAVFLAARKLDNRPLRMTLASGVAAFGLQISVQSPGVHHSYLLLPAFAAPLGAGALLALRGRARLSAVCALGLAALTLTPIAQALPAAGWLPTLAIPPAPRSDLSELSRLRDWTDAQAAPDRRYCVLGSSLVVSGVLLDELWQLEPVRAPVWRAADRDDVVLPQVDARDGPPGAGLRDCAFLLVADPVQTSLAPDFQLSVVIPAREVLSGRDIGAKFRRMGDVFELINGVKLVAFERTAPLTDEDIAQLEARWRAAPRGDAALRALKGPF